MRVGKRREEESGAMGGALVGEEGEAGFEIVLVRLELETGTGREVFFSRRGEETGLDRGEKKGNGVVR